MSRPSLRERKKAKTRATIQEHALRLFVEQGYAETTIEQIAEAAEVSQSTLFRYFPTKEDTILHDELDSPLIEALLAQPAELGPVAAIRAAIREVYAQLTPEQMAAEQARQKLAREVPEIRARTLEQYGNGAGKITFALAERLGRPRDDLQIQVMAGALIGVGLMAVLNDDVARLDDYFAILEAGF